MSDDEKPEKADKAEKALRKLEAERGLLDPEGRYKALVNAVKMAQDIIEMGDKKARFALVIMSVLNAVAVLLVVRGGDVVFPHGSAIANIVRAEFALYVVVTVYYVWQAISALRPRGVRIPAASELPAEVTPGASMRVLFYADAVGRDRAAYRAVWDSLRMDNLTTEMTDQLYTLSQINRQKYAALDRLYAGLMIMALLLGALIGTIALHQALQ
mgnify:CR=1 FL=1|jgi:hypothetical protein